MFCKFVFYSCSDLTMKPKYLSFPLAYSFFLARRGLSCENHRRWQIEFLPPHFCLCFLELSCENFYKCQIESYCLLSAFALEGFLVNDFIAIWLIVLFPDLSWSLRDFLRKPPKTIYFKSQSSLDTVFEDFDVKAFIGTVVYQSLLFQQP